jgi:tetratricopeptide (TPR) repeat protein
VCRAPLELEPQPHRDPAAARVELLAVATRPDDDPWAARARYVLGWLDEVEGRHERAAGRYHRLLLDSEADPAAVRAAVGLGRIAMREGRFDHAAAWLEQAVEREAPHETRALGLRELAVRGVLRAAGGGRAWPAAARTVETAVRGAEDLAALPDGGWLVADRKTETVTRFGLDGTPGRRWELDGVVSVAVDPFGRAYAAAGQGVFRLTEDRADLLPGTGELGPLCCLAVDGAGAVWMADRRGARLARLEPAAARSEVILESREVKLGDLVWDGRRIVATDLRTARLLAIGPDGAAETLSSLGSARPLALAADAAGQVAVLDAKVPEVVLIGPDGTIRERLSTAALGATRPAAVSLGEDGSLHLLDEATGALVSIP